VRAQDRGRGGGGGREKTRRERKREMRGGKEEREVSAANKCNSEGGENNH